MKSGTRWVSIPLVVLLLTVAISVPSSRAQGNKISTRGNSVIVGASYHNDTSPPLRDIEQLPVELRPEREANPNPRLPRHHKDSPDGAVQDQAVPSPSIPGTILNFDGIPFPGVACNCAPPDTNGEVGADAVRPDRQRGLPGLQQDDGRLGAGAFGHRHDLERLWGRLPEQW